MLYCADSIAASFVALIFFAIAFTVCVSALQGDFQ